MWVLYIWMTVGHQAGWFPFPQRYVAQDDCIVAGILLDQKNDGKTQFDCRQVEGEGK
jgi:hypothetical protein